MTTDDIRDSRTRERLLLDPPLHGAFGSVAILVDEFSASGLRALHTEPLQLGRDARLTATIPPSEFLDLRARVVWSRLSNGRSQDGKLLYRTGFRTEMPEELAEAIIEVLRTNCAAHADSESLEKKRRRLANRSTARTSRPSEGTPQTLTAGVSTAQSNRIEQARLRLKAHPDEARKWYQRARFSISKKQPSDIPYREDVLAVWEYLQYAYEIDTIASVFAAQSKRRGGA